MVLNAMAAGSLCIGALTGFAPQCHLATRADHGYELKEPSGPHGNGLNLTTLRYIANCVKSSPLLFLSFHPIPSEMRLRCDAYLTSVQDKKMSINSTLKAFLNELC